MLEFTGAVEGFVVNFLKKNFWRVQRTHDYEDAMQEAALTFHEIFARYQEKVDNDAWMMSLFKTSWTNRFNDLAQADYGARSIPPLSDLTDDDTSLLNSMVVEDPTHMASLIREAPEAVRLVLSLLYNAPKELMEQAATAWVEQGHTKVDGNAHLCGLLGIDATKVNLVEIVRSYFA